LQLYAIVTIVSLLNVNEKQKMMLPLPF